MRMLGLQSQQEIINREVNLLENDPNRKGGTTLFTSPPKILLLEDTKIIQLVNRTALTGLGCEVELATTGEECLMMFQRGYDLIFLDIGLPDIRGSKVAEYIRALEKELSLKRNLLVALTAFGEEVAEECQAVEIDDMYSKPITQAQLKEVLLKWLPKELLVPV